MNLLLKIKNDLIKFLLNLNIVISNEENSEKKKENDQNFNSEKKLVEMKVSMGREKKKKIRKYLNLKFFKSTRAFNLFLVFYN